MKKNINARKKRNEINQDTYKKKLEKERENIVTGSIMIYMAEYCSFS